MLFIMCVLRETIALSSDAISRNNDDDDNDAAREQK